MRRRTITRALCAVVLLSTTTAGMAMVACGDDTTTPPGNNTTPTSTTTATTPTPTNTNTTPTPTTTNTTPPTGDSGPPDTGSDASPTAPRTCKTILAAQPGSPSGIYVIDLDGSGTVYPPISLYCDMTFDGGGWTMIQSFTGANSPSNFSGLNDDAGVLGAPPEPKKLGGLGGWVVKALADISTQIHIRLSFQSDAGADGGTWVTTKPTADDGGTTHAMYNLRDLKVLTKGTDGGFEDWTGPKATAQKLAWVPLYGGSAGTCGNPVEQVVYPSIYWACGNFSSMNILQSQGLCRWEYTPNTQNEPMEVFVR